MNHICSFTKVIPLQKMPRLRAVTKSFASFCLFFSGRSLHFVVVSRAAETVGCRVHGITLSKEQKALAEEKVADF